MTAQDSATHAPRIAANHGTALAALGVLGFSFSFPATAWALDGFGPWTATGLRGVLAALLALACLAAQRVPVPERRHWRGLATVAAGCVIGFPLLTTLALRTSSTAHSAVVIGLLPLATAVMSVALTGERPSRRFWYGAVAGAVAVIAFTLQQSQGAPTLADLYLFCALLVCAAGYAEGGRLSRHMAGWQVIGWAVVAALPVTTVTALVAWPAEAVPVTPRGVGGLLYVAAVSQFGGFVVWYRGMGLIGVARASQLQLAQPLLTLAWSALFLAEQVPPAAPATAVVVLLCITSTQRARA
ncbi:DMT family transporter [Actinacidiphila bryophytorum]|uniref:DMT family transporter n=1 Tax=Actinacidiphila bryophytorum TaxID=1436133 RepID=UPI002176B5F7|nr:DMT family transporter [Actinacidiphila bryophytorum]UWE07733.1 DMT family transporter [Actinacidiphila bryophytorum]